MTGLTTESLLRIRIAVVEEENAKLREAIDNALLCDTAVQMSEALQAALLEGK